MAPAVDEITIGAESDFDEGSHRLMDIGGRSVGIYRSNGTFYAVQNVCAHALAPICVSPLTGTYLPSEPDVFTYGMEGLVLRCPWHTWEFDVRDGKSLFTGDQRRLKTFPVRVEDGNVIISMRVRRRSTTAATSKE
jgi:nitrite reductase (NADH) small subunit